jgi:uncharacterized protein (TIGR03083 family)
MEENPSAELQALVSECYLRLATILEQSAPAAWDQPSLCAGWRVREVVAHVTMPARFTEKQFMDELASAQGDFQAVSDAIAARDSHVPIPDHLANLRSTTLAAWQPPGGGAINALNHAVVHSLDVTNALGLTSSFSDDAARAILDSLTGGGAARFGVDLEGRRLEATDLDWAWGSGEPLVGTSAELISLATHRTLVDGRTLS